MVADKSINLDNIFSLFSPEGEIGKDNEKVFIALTQSPIYLIGMYKKLVLNYVVSSRKIVESLRILKPGGKFLCLEFSKVDNNIISKI